MNCEAWYTQRSFTAVTVASFLTEAVTHQGQIPTPRQHGAPPDAVQPRREGDCTPPGRAAEGWAPHAPPGHIMGGRGAWAQKPWRLGDMKSKGARTRWGLLGRWLDARLRTPWGAAPPRVNQNDPPRCADHF